LRFVPQIARCCEATQLEDGRDQKEKPWQRQPCYDDVFAIQEDGEPQKLDCHVGEHTFKIVG
jgi:hypothetical protein